MSEQIEEDVARLIDDDVQKIIDDADKVSAEPDEVDGSLYSAAKDILKIYADKGISETKGSFIEEGEKNQYVGHV